MNNTILKYHPAVFTMEDEYLIVTSVDSFALMWAEVDGKRYYDHSNGILVSSTLIHKISVPKDSLDRAQSYTIGYRKIIDRKPYFPQTEDEVSLTYDFCPVPTGDVRAYHISDAHGMVQKPILACRTFENNFGKIHLLVLNGDIANHSGKAENFDHIYEIASQITGGKIPIVFSKGNHELRGAYAECAADYTPTYHGKSYYTFRAGSVWGMVLDCGEDKPDSHAEYGNTVCFHDFRLRETEFMEFVANTMASTYNADGVEHKIVVVHNPFTLKKKPPFDIEEELFGKWCKILKSTIKPDVMLCGHTHDIIVRRPGDEGDFLGQPCPTVEGGKPVFENNERIHVRYTGAGFLFSHNGTKIVFTDSDGQIVATENI